MSLLQGFDKTTGLFLALFIAAFLPLTLQAQVTVTVGDVAASVGQEVDVPVLLSGVEAGIGVNSFQITVTSDNAGVVVVRPDAGSANFHIATGSLAQSFTVSSNDANGRIGGFTSSNNAFTGSGTLIFIRMKATAAVSATISLNDFKLNSGNPAHTPTVPSFTFDATGGGGNNTPIANDDSFAMQEDTALRETAPGLLSNDADADSDALTAAVETDPNNGSVSLAANGSFVYIPSTDFSGTDTFTYVANDGTVNSSAATVTITVTAVNDAPVAQNGAASTSTGDAVLITLVATDAEGDALTYEILAPTIQGGVSAVSGNQVTYTPNTGFTGSDNFVFRANDGTDNSNNATVTITVAGNNEPVAADETYTVEEDDVLSVSGAGGVLSNDTDGDSDPLTAVLLTTTSDGNLTLNPDGGFFYEPAVDFFGQDSFTYQASDGTAASNAATATITVTPTGNARIQVIHNAPDAAVDPADIYVDGDLFLFNAPYGQASPFVDHVDGTIQVTVAPNGAGLGAAVGTFAVTLEEDKAYVVIFGGSTSNGFEVHSIPNAQESTTNDRFEAFFFQGGPNLPTVDVVAVSDNLNSPGEVTVLGGAEFGDYTPYLPNVPGQYNFGIRTLGGSDVEVFRLNLAAGAGKTYAAVVGGLLSGSSYPLTMRAYDATGTAVTASVVTAVEPDNDLVPKTFLLRGNYPNPFNPRTNIQFDLPEAAEVGVRVTDLLGREMLSIPAQQMSAGTNLYIPVDAAELASGIYIYRVVARAAREMYVATGTMTLIK
ncbi:MAG: VCBS repeat-containing protein [Rhodothermales bacterium]|jgi:VCBS repeat-containing protein